MPIETLSRRKLIQRCKDLEFLLVKYAEQERLCKFEAHLLVNMYEDPIGFQIEAEYDKGAQRLLQTVDRLRDTPFMKALDCKWDSLKAGMYERTED